MRFVRADPKAERLPVPTLLEKGLEVLRLVIGAEMFQRRFQLEAVVLAARRIVSEPAAFPISGGPAFSRAADVVARLLQQVGINRILGREATVVAAGLVELPGVAARQNAGSARAAFGIGRKGVAKENSLAGDAVEGRRLDPTTAGGARMIPAPIVRDQEQDVRPLIGRGLRFESLSQAEDRQNAQQEAASVMAEGQAFRSLLSPGDWALPQRTQLGPARWSTWHFST